MTGLNEVSSRFTKLAQEIVREMPLLGRHKNIIVAGVADAITFFKASPVLLCEHKFSSKPIPFRDHHVQARLYCYLLNLMGFDTSNLQYALVLAPPESREDDKLREISLCILQNPQEKLKASSKSCQVTVADPVNCHCHSWSRRFHETLSLPGFS